MEGCRVVTDRKDDGTEHGVDRDSWLRVLPFVQARDYTIPTRARVPRLIVVHATDDAERAGSAHAVARYFVNPDRQGSAHFAVDPVEIVQCVDLAHVAWGARGANLDGIHVELCGEAGQSAGDWEDEASAAIVARGARLVGALCRRFSIPVRRLTVEQIRDGVSRGICGHVDVSETWPPPRGGHWDPGPGFPWETFLGLVGSG